MGYTGRQEKILTNEQIIAETAIAAGLYSEEEVLNFLDTEGELPLHSLLGWKHRSPKGYEYRIKKGEHGVECRLWQKRKKTDKSTEENTATESEILPNFYLVKTFLFDKSQIEMVKLEG